MSYLRPSSITEYIYRPTDPRPKGESEQVHRQRSEDILAKARSTQDFFLSADNSSLDLDPMEGSVKLEKAPAPASLGSRTSFVSGNWDKEKREFLAKTYDSSQNHQSNLVLTNNEDGSLSVMSNRPAQDDAPNPRILEGVDENLDGTVRYVTLKPRAINLNFDPSNQEGKLR